MIRSLHVKNLGIIESATVEFQGGFLVVSGETGSGKSILVTAIAFALGARADADFLRTGADEASVSLTLDLSSLPRVHRILEEGGLGEIEEGDWLCLRRTLHSAGRSRAFVNDQPVTLKTLQAIGQASVHQVAQHGAQDLLEEAFLVAGIDRSAGLQNPADAYRAAFRLYHLLRQEHLDWRAKVERVREREDFLRFQFQELQNAALRTGEEEELEVKRQRLKHRVALAEQHFQMQQGLLEADDSILTQLGRIQLIAQKAAALDPSLGAIPDHLGQAEALLQEAGRALSGYTDGLQEDPGELDQIEGRLAELTELKRKYRLEIPGLIEKAEELKGQVEDLERFDDRLAEAERGLSRAREELRARAKEISLARHEAARVLEKKLTKILKDLALAQARVEFRFSGGREVDNFRELSPEDLKLWVSFNPGEELRPMDEVISGGELSRLLLAFCEVLYPAEELGTMVFDEIDAGVGGRVAELIGKKLETLSRKVQVLCVTHLPQIACHGKDHYTVEKEIRGGRTFSRICRLAQEERIREIARMLAGVKITDQALSHARELLKNAAA